MMLDAAFAFCQHPPVYSLAHHELCTFRRIEPYTRWPIYGYAAAKSARTIGNVELSFYFGFVYLLWYSSLMVMICSRLTRYQRSWYRPLCAGGGSQCRTDRGKLLMGSRR